MELAPDNEQVKKNLAKAQRRLAISHNSQGIEQARAGDFQDAIESYKQALKLAPDNEQVKKNLASAYSSLAHSQYMNGDFKNSYANYSHLLELDPNDTSAIIDRSYAVMGQVYKLGQSSETSAQSRELAGRVVNNLTKFLQTDGLSDADKARALYLQGFAYKATEDNNSALECFRQSYLLDKNNHHALMEGADLYYGMGRYDMAEKCYIQAMNTGKLNEQDQNLAQKRVLRVADIHARRQAMQDEYRRMA